MTRISDDPHPDVLVDLVSRIEETDGGVRAFIPEDDRLGRLTSDGIGDGPLAGIPVAIKDLYTVTDLPTRAGSRLPAELFAADESTVVTRLRAAGAIIAGKTAMDEFAYCEPPPTRNPRDLRRTPGGSSGGSAAAVAAGMCPLAVGSQTLQSIIVPAAYCGVVGYKPTYRRIRFDGVPLAPAFDTVGFLADSVARLARTAKLVVPGWESTEVSTRPRLGVPPPWGLRRLHTRGWAAFERHTMILNSLGFELREARLPWNDDLQLWADRIGDLLHGEMAAVHSVWYAQYRELYRPRTAAAVERGKAISTERVSECRRAQDSLRGMLEDLTEEAGIDCWICPAIGAVAPVGYENTGDSWLTSFWSYAGWPQLTIPIFDGPDGLSLGLQLISPAGTDEQLLTWAAAIESALDAWPWPMSNV